MITRVPAQWALRALVALLPAAALLLAVPAGGRGVPGWVVLLVVASSLVWAVRTEGPAGMLALAVTVGWWARGVPDLSGWAVPAGGLLVLAHCAALVASLGPADLSPGAWVLRLWGRRALLLAAATLPPYAVGWLLLEGGAEAPPWIWPVAAGVAAVAGLAAVAAAVGEEQRA